MLEWQKRYLQLNFKRLNLFLLSLFLLVSQMTYADNFVIGVPLSLTGENGDNGNKILNALNLYVDQVNQLGGVNDQNLELRVLDDRSDPEQAKKNAKELADDEEVLAVVGHSEQETADAAAPIYNKAKLVFYTPSEIDEAITKANPYAFSGIYGESTQQQMLAAYIKIFKGDNVLLINAAEDKGKEKVSAFEKFAKQAGLKVTSLNTTDPDKVTDSKAKVDAIVLYAQPKAADIFLKNIRKANNNTPIYGDDYILSEIANHLTESYAYNVFGTLPFSYSIAPFEAQRFVQAYSATFGDKPSVASAFAYDGITLVARAYRQEKVDRQKVYSYFNSLRSVQTGQQGITGRLFFDESNHIFHNIIVSGPFQGAISPAFDQIKRAPANVNKNDKDYQIAEVDKVPYYKISVVYIGLDFKKITKLNTTTKDVEVDAFLWLKWHGDVDVDNIVVQNQSGDTKKVEIKKTEIEESPGNKFNYGVYTARIPINYTFQLEDFPFDRQIIPITISHDIYDSNRIVLAVESDFINKQPVGHPEWDYLVRLDSSGSFSYNSSLGYFKRSDIGANVKPEYSTYEIYLVMQRKIFSYVFSIFLPLLIIIFICFLAFMIKINNAGDVNSRRGLVTGMLFATVVSHLAMRNSLQTTYLVAADYFYLVTYVIIAAEMLVFSIEGLVIANDQEKAWRIDRIARAVIIGGTIVAIAVLIFMFVL